MYKKKKNSSDKDKDSNSDSDSDDQEDPYAVSKGKSNKDCIYQPPCCEAKILPSLPASFLIVGKSGSGKTKCAVKMLTSKRLLKNSFDFLYMFVGVKPDKSLIKKLEIPESNIFKDFKEEDLSGLLTKLEKACEKNSKNLSLVPTVAIIFDDILNRPKILKSDTMTKLFTCNRHFNVSPIILSQYYKKLPPVIRTNCSSLIFFPSPLSEVIKIAEEQCPPGKDKKTFIKLFGYATKETYSFMSINTRVAPEDMLRKGFNKVIG